MRVNYLITLAAMLTAGPALAGPFAPAAGQAGSTAIAKNDAAIKGWATAVTEYTPGPNVDATFKTPALALGPAVGTSFDIVSLGDQGHITLTFSGTLFDGPSWDFAVFENGFSDTFLELAFVEVSSDGTHFFRFPNFSFTPAAVGGFGTIAPTNIDGYAGKYRQGFGTPFDLHVFAGVSGIDINKVSQIRLVDIKGNGTEFDNLPAEFGGPDPIFDPFPTSGSGGFDLDAIGVSHLNLTPPPIVPPVLAPVPVPPALGLFALSGLALIRAVRRRSAAAGEHSARTLNSPS